MLTGDERWNDQWIFSTRPKPFCLPRFLEISESEARIVVHLIRRSSNGLVAQMAPPKFEVRNLRIGNRKSPHAKAPSCFTQRTQGAQREVCLFQRGLVFCSLNPQRASSLASALLHNTEHFSVWATASTAACHQEGITNYLYTVSRLSLCRLTPLKLCPGQHRSCGKPVTALCLLRDRWQTFRKHP